MSDEFNTRLDAAIRRGQQRAEHQASTQRQRELSDEELRRLHTSHRLTLCDRIESSVHRVADHFPGFRVESVYGEGGWGTACYRDDLRIEAGKRNNQYSRLEIVIRPYSDLRVLDMKGKGTVMNRELFNRNHYVSIADVDLDEFQRLIDAWTIEYAEIYAAKSAT